MDSYRVPEIAKKYTEYDMIQTHTNLPDYPHSRTRLLFAFLNKGSKLTDYSELFALVTSLVQMGMDTHDLVDASQSLGSKKDARSRQLKVLAGDYFSSRFYHLLSQAGQIDVVKHLSNAICEVNRLKMNLYMKMKQLKLSAEDYIQHTVNIRMQLFLSFSKWMDGLYHSNWPDILRGFTRCEVIAEEIYRTDSLDGFNGSWAYWHIMQNASVDEQAWISNEQDPTRLQAVIAKYKAKDLLFQMLDNQIQHVMQIAQQLGSDKILSELQQLSAPFKSVLSAPKVLEEI